MDKKKKRKRKKREKILANKIKVGPKGCWWKSKNEEMSNPNSRGITLNVKRVLLLSTKMA